nr:MAG: xanthine dehydrogenase family protein molybdopterin-binding subunit [Hyphomicrobiales bacterium]
MEGGVSRRQFVATALTAGGGFAIALVTSKFARAATLPDVAWQAASTGDIPEFNPWIVINPDETVVIRIPFPEIGNGISTTLPQIVTEELHCDWSNVRAEFASPNRNAREGDVYGDMVISGNRGVITKHFELQQAGASARERLIAAAALRWNVSPRECSAESSRVVHEATGRSASYGALATEAANIQLDTEPRIKSPDEYIFLGRSLKRLDIPHKVDGSAMFGIDVRLPNMVYAAVANSPVIGGKVLSVDDTPIKGRRGIIKVVSTDNHVAVIADSYWRAKQALNQLNIVWEPGPGRVWNTASVSEKYHGMLDAPHSIVRDEGDAKSVLSEKSDEVVEAVYEVPFLAHAPMEPQNTTVYIQSDRIDIWNGTQSPLNVLRRAAQMAGVSPDNVYVHTGYVGGGYGRRTRGTEIQGAMEVALASGLSQPIKVIWSREEDTRGGYYRPKAVTRFRAVLGQDGMPEALEAQIAAASIRLSFERPLSGYDPFGNELNEGVDWTAIEVINSVPYKIPNHYIGQVVDNIHIPVAYWRTVGASQNAFFMESFIDELAVKAGQDPLAYRRAMTDRPDFLMVMDELEKRSGWGTPLSSEAGYRRARGIAAVQRKHLVDGSVAEITVTDDGEIIVDRVVTVIDFSHPFNPSITEAQVQGSVCWSLSAMFYGDITLKNGVVQEGNFDTYPVLRMAKAPRIEVYRIRSDYFTGENQWGGVGELGGSTAHAAVANALYSATGVRVRRLPLKNIDRAVFAR